MTIRLAKLAAVLRIVPTIIQSLERQSVAAPRG